MAWPRPTVVAIADPPETVIDSFTVIVIVSCAVAPAASVAVIICV